MNSTEIYKERAREPLLNSEGEVVRLPRVTVGVRSNGRVVWETDVYPFFYSLQTSLFKTVRRPGYRQRIISAEKKAQKIASKLK